MKLFGLTAVELAELWPYASQLRSNMLALLKAREARGFSRFVVLRDLADDVIEAMRRRITVAPDAPTAAEQNVMDRASASF